jgi:hypothetical protein
MGVFPHIFRLSLLETAILRHHFSDNTPIINDNGDSCVQTWLTLIGGRRHRTRKGACARLFLHAPPRGSHAARTTIVHTLFLLTTAARAYRKSMFGPGHMPLPTDARREGVCWPQAPAQ